MYPCVYLLQVLKLNKKKKKKKGSFLSLYTPVSPSIPEMGGTYATGGILFLRMQLWWSLYTLYLLARQAELWQVIHVFAVVSLVC